MPCLANSPANTIQMNVKKETIFFCFRFFLKDFLMCAQRHKRHYVV